MAAYKAIRVEIYRTENNIGKAAPAAGRFFIMRSCTPLDAAGAVIAIPSGTIYSYSTAPQNVYDGPAGLFDGNNGSRWAIGFNNGGEDGSGRFSNYALTAVLPSGQTIDPRSFRLEPDTASSNGSAGSGERIGAFVAFKIVGISADNGETVLVDESGRTAAIDWAGSPLGKTYTVASGAAAIAATATTAFGAIGLGAYASTPLTAIGSAMLAPVTASGAAGSAIIASAARRIGDVVASGAGAALVSSSAAADLAAVLIAGSASLPVGATSEQSLTPASAAGTGGLAITASSSPVLRPVGAAVVAAVTITGLAAGAVVAPINVAASAGAQQLTAAFAAIDLAAIGAIGASSVDLQRNVAATLSALAGVGSANVPAVGNAGVLIGHTAGQAIARTGIAGLAAVSIGSVASTVQARTIVTAVIAAGLRPVTVVGLGATGSAPVGPIVIPARNRFVIPARQRSFTVPPRQRSFLIRKGTCMSSITKYAAEERQYQADWSADLNGQTIVGDIVPLSNDPTLIVDRVTYDGPIMKFWVQGGTSGKVATIRFVAPTSGGEDLAWQQMVVVY